MELHGMLLTLGALLLVGLAMDELGRRTRLPRVTLLILCGLAAGLSGFDLLPAAFHDWYAFLAAVALTMVAFLLGGKLTGRALRLYGRQILVMSLVAVIVTASIVAVGLIAIGTSVVLALLLAGIATATDPAATQDVVRQTRAKGPFTDLLLGIVAVDDAWGLVAFSMLLIAGKAIMGDGGIAIVQHGLWEIGGSLALGAAVGLPAAALTGRLKPGEPIQSEALGLVFVCAGLALWLELSFLLAGMAAGAVVANLAKHHTRPFHEIEHIEWPFMVVFFVLAGASLHVESIGTIGAVGAAYLVLRSSARLVGGWAGGRLAHAPAHYRRWIGLALAPQAGVALGMALVAADNFPDLGEVLLTVTIATTVVFEVIGPLMTQVALRQTGEAA
jgi:Kef-type K+ transport system membrane component KefB